MPELTTVKMTLGERLLIQSLLVREKDELEQINKVLVLSIADKNDVYKLSYELNERRIREIEDLIKRLEKGVGPCD